MRQLSIGLFVVVVSLALPGLLLAHTPTPGNASWAPNATSAYKWDSLVPAWLKTSVQDVLEVKWPSASSNNSRRVIFSYNSAGAGTVFFQDTTAVPACNNTPGWLGCADGAGTSTWRTWIRKTANWCDLNSVTGCYDSRRVAIHEVAHVGGFLGHMDTLEADTVMTLAPPQKAVSGWNTSTIQRCDAARMQLLYDLANSAGPYANCFDHITGAGTTGLLSNATVSATSGFACTGQGISVSGRLDIKVDANYGPLGGNPLSLRTLFFDRRLVGTTTWTLNYASTSVSNASGYNWTASFGSSTAGSYEFRGRYAGETGVVGVNTPIFTLTWSNGC